jgi:hypothetical protein
MFELSTALTRMSAAKGNWHVVTVKYLVGWLVGRIRRRVGSVDETGSPSGKCLLVMCECHRVCPFLPTS